MAKANHFRVLAAGAVLAMLLLLLAAGQASAQTVIAAPAIDYPANNSFSADGIIQFSGPSYPDVNVDLYEVFDNGQKNNVGTSLSYPDSPCGPTGCDCEAGCYGIEWYWGISLTGVADGPHTYYAVTDDGNGNVSDPSNSVTVVVDRSIPPTVDSIHPYDGETTTGPVGEVSAGFSEKVDPNTLTTSTFTLVKHESDGSTTLVDATDATVASYNWPYFYNMVLLRLPSYLEGGTKYTATIKGGPDGVKDETGFPLANDKVWSFTTATWPTVDAVSPSDGATQQPTTSNITATFSKHMMWGPFRKDMKWYSLTWPQTDCTECIQLFTLVKEGSTTPVDATVTYNTETRKATMDPSGELQENTKYTATVKGESDGIQDAWTNPMAEDKVWSFTTGEVSPPETTIGSGPSGTVSSTSASFSFSSSETGSTFQCSLDGAAFANCPSPKVYDNLLDGDHTFEVRATDSDGNTDPTPASRTWTVATLPVTTIGSGPSDGSYVKSTSASFSFSSSEAGSTFQCSRDGSTFSACTSPKSYSSLSQGNHTFRVRAIDTAGNIDASPATRSWFVDTVVPKGTISIKGGAASTSSRLVTLWLTASDPSPASGVDSMRFRNGGTTTWSSWFDYTSSHSWTLTAGAGTKSVYVQYKDRAGNVSASAYDTIKFSP